MGEKEIDYWQRKINLKTWQYKEQLLITSVVFMEDRYIKVLINPDGLLI